MNVFQKINDLGKFLNQSEKWSKNIVISLLIFVYIPIFSINASHHIEDKLLSSGSKQYFLCAYHMLRHGIYSMSYGDSPDVRPSSYRPPGYSTFLAACLSIIPDFQGITLKDIVKRDERGKKIIDSKENSGFMKIKSCEAFLYLIVSLLCMWMTLKITKKPYAAILVLVWVGLHPKMSSSLNQLHSEILQSFLVTMFSVSMYYIIEKRNIFLFAVSGLLLGCLTLTRATWYYFWIPALLFFIYLLWYSAEERKKIISGSIIFFVCFTVIAGGWMIRNYLQFERALISERGGVALDIRMNKNMMTWKEYKASFFFWSKNKYLSRTLLKKYFEPEDYRRHDRSNPDSFYQTARTRRHELNKFNTPQVADKLQLNEAINKLVQHPFRNILVTLPITLRGIQKFGHNNTGILMIFITCIALFDAIKNKKRHTIAFLSPALLIFAFNCFLTHNIPRFNLPYIPIFIVSSFIGLEVIIKWYKKKFSNKRGLV